MHAFEIDKLITVSRTAFSFIILSFPAEKKEAGGAKVPAWPSG